MTSVSDTFGAYLSNLLEGRGRLDGHIPAAAAHSAAQAVLHLGLTVGAFGTPLPR